MITLIFVFILGCGVGAAVMWFVNSQRIVTALQEIPKIRAENEQIRQDCRMEMESALLEQQKVFNDYLSEHSLLGGKQHFGEDVD